MRKFFLKKLIKKLLLISLLLNLFLVFLIYKAANKRFSFDLFYDSLGGDDEDLPYICNKTINNYIIDTSLDFNLNPKDSLCQPSSNENVLLVAFVIIAPRYFEKRMLIRKTWGNKQKFRDMRLIFVLGKSKNETLNEMIVKEYNQHKDIIQKDFIDSYRNLTAKVMMSFNWITKYCSNSKYILRINDDVIVNTYSLISYLKQLEYKNSQIFGLVLDKMAVDRNPNSKYYVSYKQYSKRIYVLYPEGSAYLLTTDLAYAYYNKSVNMYCPPFSFWLEDVFIGMLAYMLQTRVNDLTPYYIPNSQYSSLTKTEKLEILLKKRMNETFFIFEKNDFAYFWHEIKRINP